MTIASYLLVGLLIGLVSGMLGIGGAVLLIPILIWFYGFDQPRAIGTTLAVLVPPVGLGAALEYYKKGLMELEVAVFLAVSFALGAYLGAVAMPYIPKEALRIFFALLLIYIAVLIIAGDYYVTSAAAGLVVVGLTWLAALGLRTLGRRCQPPKLGEEIARFQKQTPDEPDYYI